MKRILLALAGAMALGGSGAASAALIDRGGGLIYDTVLDITWTQNANLCADDGVCPTTWDAAVAWADGLVFGGFDDWRLASMSVAGGLPTGSASSVVNCATASEADCRDNELGYMYYHNLTPAGDTPPTDSLTDLTGNRTTADGSVTINNIQSGYWSGTEFAPDPGGAWFFVFFNGIQGDFDKGVGFAAWAVRPGDVLAAVPEPSTGLLVGTVVLALGLKRRRQAARTSALR